MVLSASESGTYNHARFGAPQQEPTLATYGSEERTKLRKAWVDHAIQLAMQNRWAEAVTVNRNIIELFPNDVEAHNRLGRSLREQGQYKDAREAYRRAVEIDPNNSIAQKNLSSLQNI